MSALLVYRKALGCLILVAAFLGSGCEEDDWRTVELDVFSLAATDSVAPGESLEVQFGYFATGEDQFSSHSWEMVDPATLRLRVFHRFRESDPAIGAPAFLTSSAVWLESPPARSFRIVAGEVSLRVQGGAEWQPANRLTVVLTENGQSLEGADLELSFADPEGEGMLVPLPPTDADGLTRVVDVCPGVDSRFRIESSDGRHRVRATARWPSSCDLPLRLSITGTELQAPTEP